MKRLLSPLLIFVLMITAYAASVPLRMRYLYQTPPRVNTIGMVAHYKLSGSLETPTSVFDYQCDGKDGTLTDTDATFVPQ